MQLKIFPIIPQLQDHIEKIWLFESEQKLAEDDLKMIVPNGRIKLIIPIHDVATSTDGTDIVSSGNRIFLIGITDVPRFVQDQKNNPSGTIGIEIFPSSAYLFFRTNFAFLKNRIVALREVSGHDAKEIESKLMNATKPEEKVKLLQQFLVSQLILENQDPVFELCIQKIESSGGEISIADLEKATGYSARWLNIKFNEKLGLSPKKFAGIIRFQEFYKSLNKNPITIHSQKDFYDRYHDQAHFIKEFKKFAGLPPARLAKAVNDFGRRFAK